MGIGFRELIILAVLVGVYFLPHWIAVRRDHLNKNAIFVLNLLADWTIVGWVWAMVWAFSNSNQASAKADPDSIPCPRCAETIKSAAKVCRFCGAPISSDP